jgi:hypothetical protein
MCTLALDALVKAHFLCLNSNGTYVRLIRQRGGLTPAKTALRSTGFVTTSRRASECGRADTRRLRDEQPRSGRARPEHNAVPRRLLYEAATDYEVP